jgi:hypothetical protein
MLLYRVSVKAVQITEKDDESTVSKFVDVGIYDVETENGFDDAADLAYVQAKQNKSYQEIMSDTEVQLQAVNIKLLTKVGDL